MTVRDAPWLVRAQTVGGNLVIETTLDPSRVAAALHEMNVRDVRVESLPPTLERVFTQLTREAQTHD